MLGHAIEHKYAGISQNFFYSNKLLLNTLNINGTANHHYFWGISEIEFDHLALKEGYIVIKKCNGVFPDKTKFSISSHEKKIISKSLIEHLDKNTTVVNIYLSINGLEDSEKNNNTHMENWRIGSQKIGVIKTTSFSSINGLQYKILLDNEYKQNDYTLLIGKLNKKKNELNYCDDYIPPILKVGSSKSLQIMISALLEFIIEKSIELSANYLPVLKNDANCNTTFRLIKTLNSYIPLFSQCIINPDIHPYQLYSIITMFKGAIDSFSNCTIKNKAYVQYEHNDLMTTFKKAISELHCAID